LTGSVIIALTFITLLLGSCGKKEEPKAPSSKPAEKIYTASEVKKLIVGTWRDAARTSDYLTFTRGKRFQGYVRMGDGQIFRCSGEYDIPKANNLILYFESASLNGQEAYGGAKSGGLKLTKVTPGAIDIEFFIGKERLKNGRMVKSP